MSAPKRRALEGAVEVALTAGLLASGLLMLCGLGGLEGGLKWGILLLLLTPVARVIVVTAGLFYARDWVFGLISLWVLGVLASGMWMASRM